MATLLAALLLAACGGGTEATQQASTVAVSAAGTPAQVATPTSIPTVSPTRVPPTSAPTVTPAPSQTATPAPSATLQPAEPPSTFAEPSRRPAPEPAVYFFPVQQAKVRYVDYHHDYPAADIECALGSRFVAVTGGVVDFVSAEDLWRPDTDNPPDRSGLAVAIVGDDGVRYYGSHLSEIAAGIAPGVRVQAGQLLGLTGNSGNAGRPGIVPHLHFGISPPTAPDDWLVRRGTIRPYDYLQAWQRGENVVPKL